VRRIDLGDENSEDGLDEALRQLEKQQASEPAPREEPSEARQRLEEERREAYRKSRAEIEGAIEEIREEKAVSERPPRPAPARPRLVVWSLLGVAVLLAVGLTIIALRPEPLPPRAGSPTSAVRGFWSAVIEGKYEAATVHYPGLVAQYGGRKQAALRLEEWFKADPPVHIASVGEPQESPDSPDLRVSYQVYMRSGRPRSGEAIISEIRRPELAYVIISGI
jgi:hypothetical protein